MDRRTEAAWDTLAIEYSQRYKLSDSAFHLGPNGPGPDELGLDLLKLDRGSNVLDIGCGSGANAVCMAKLGHLVTGIDISGVQIELAIARARDAEVEVNFLRGDVGGDVEVLGECVPFDLCYAIFSLEYVRDLGSVFGRIASLTKPGGRFLYCDLHPAVSFLDIGASGDGPVADYFTDSAIEFFWPNTRPGSKTVRYHRPLSRIVSLALANGLLVRGCYEPESYARPGWAYDDPDIDTVLASIGGSPHTLVLEFERRKLA